jgi:conjugative element/phage-associated large polyvalent protein
MTDRRHIDTADVAKLIRVELKKTFPATKFSVNSKRYAGGSSIRVSWTDGPTKKRVEDVIGHFHGASFDGMIDLKSYHDSEHDGEKVHFGNDYLFCDRELSPGFVTRVAEEVERRIGRPVPRTMAEASATRATWLENGGCRWMDSVIRNFAENRDPAWY